MNHPFHIPEEITYLNCAYMAPLSNEALQAGIAGLSKKCAPWEFTPDDFFEPVKELQTLFAKVIGAAEPERVALIPSASYGLANALNNTPIQKGQKIVGVEGQFPSNVYGWQKLAASNGGSFELISEPADSADRTRQWNEDILSAITDQTAAVALPQVHWSDGTLFNLPAIRKRSREVGALLIIDGTQSVGAMELNVDELQPDALICAGYKWLLGPYSVGLAWYGPAFDNGNPIEDNWIQRKDSHQFADLVNYQPEYRTGAARYSVGELSNFALNPVMKKGLETVLELGVQNIAAHTEKISRKVKSQLVEMGCGVITDSPHLFGLRPGPGFELERIKQTLKEEKIMVSYRGDAIRISPHVYNSEKDFELLSKCIERCYMPGLV